MTKMHVQYSQVKSAMFVPCAFTILGPCIALLTGVVNYLIINKTTNVHSVYNTQI